VGFAIAAIVGAVLSFRLSPAWPEVTAGVLLGLSVQAPLGWWTVRSIGTERFQLVWVAGMLIRLSLVGVTALVLVPAFAWRLPPALGALVVTVLVLLLVEVLTAVQGHSGIKLR
jgi:hypothetical protein